MSSTKIDYLISLPWKSAFQQEQERICKRLQIVSPAGCTPKVRMHTSIPNRTSAATVNMFMMREGCEGRLATEPLPAAALIAPHT